METDIRLFDAVDSTNITLKELADNGAAEGTCVMALSQRRGQGRSGRTFFSPEGGNLYMSLLLRPQNKTALEMITVTAAVAVVEAIKERFGIMTGIKWVNDIMLCGRKVCGIVAHAHDIGTSGRHVILGIGVNVFTSRNIPEDIADRYGSILDETFDLTSEEGRNIPVGLGKSIINRFADYYESGSYDDVIARYRKYSSIIGKKVEYISGDESIEATVAGIDDNGGIILDTGGKVRSYRDGEIRISIKDK